MVPSVGYIQRCAADTGFSAAVLEKVVRLGEVAADIARHPFLRERLLLKGGTALNLCFGAPERLSVDLDYNYVGYLERSRMLAERPQVEAMIVELATRLGYRVQHSADAFAGRIVFLRYRSMLGGEDLIKIDLNFLSPERIMAMGFTLFMPTYFGAEPWLGSKTATLSQMLPEQAKPSPPTSWAQRSLTMSPNMLLATRTP